MVVVLSQRDKLAMEGDFRRLLPPAARFGTTFVFRQARAATCWGQDRDAPAAARVCVLPMLSRAPPHRGSRAGMRLRIACAEVPPPGLGSDQKRE